ncbi:MAG TPA: hypothetical protein VMG12_14120 [Polyangiaceae bacterium]|nr:hypothetical protein [Polyangiaceae bacterium]
MRVRVIIGVLYAVSAAAGAETPAPAASVGASVDVSGQVPLDCDKPLGAFQFATGRYEQKVKSNTQTWEDVANYHQTRAEWLECVARSRVRALEAERAAHNATLAKLDESNARLAAASTEGARLDQEIADGQQQFALCDKTPVPADQALAACGPQAFVNDCSNSTVKRLFTAENGREGGPRGHIIRSIIQQQLARRVSWLQCLANNAATVPSAPSSPVPAPQAPAAPVSAQKAASNP